MMQKTLSIGVDIGGSHICCTAIDLNKHKLLPATDSHLKINNKASSEEILSGWSKAIESTISKIDRNQLKGIGFAMPGPFDYPNGIALFERVEKYESLYGISIIEEMIKRLGLDKDTQIRFINDATSFAIAEAWIGKASEYERMLALTLGTGFGSAFLDKGIPVIEGDLVPQMGCVWHLPFLNGIADDYFSTRWFVDSFASQTGIVVHGVKEIANLVDTNPEARELFNTYGTNMGHFLAPWLKKFDAEVVVIGGNITGSYDLFGSGLFNSLSLAGLKTEIRLSELKEDAAIIGSARLIDEMYWMQIKDLISKM
jgi:glucokinase